MEFAAEKRDGSDGAERDNWDGDIGDSGLVYLRPEKESQHQDNPPMDRKNRKCIAGNIAEDSLENADGGNVWNLARKQECCDEADNACDRTCDKLGEALAQVVVHDAEIRARRFQKSVGDKACNSDGSNDGCVFCGVSVSYGNGAVDFFDGFLAKKTATKEKENRKVAFNAKRQVNVIYVEKPTAKKTFYGHHGEKKFGVDLLFRHLVKQVKKQADGI